MICFTLFCREIFFDGIYTVLLQIPFCCNSCCLLQDLFGRDLRTFRVEKNYTQDFVRGEKMTNIMYVISYKSADIQHFSYIYFINRDGLLHWSWHWLAEDSFDLELQ